MIVRRLPGEDLSYEGIGIVRAYPVLYQEMCVL